MSEKETNFCIEALDPTLNLSAEIITISSGTHLEDLSTLTDLSASDLEDNTVNDDAAVAEEQTSIMAQSNVIESTLVKNANLLTDKSILEDLLPYNNKLDQIFATNIANDEDSLTHDSIRKDPPEASIPGPYLSISSTPKKQTQSNCAIEHDRNEGPERCKKQVKFLTTYKSPKKISQVLPTITNDIDYVCKTFTDSFINQGNFISKLSDIRHCIAKSPSDGLSLDASPDFNPMNEFLFHQLNVQKQKNKDLEEELALSLANLTKITKELEILQTRIARREDQLRAANLKFEGQQIELKAYQQGITAQRNSANSKIEKLSDENQEFKKENSSLKLKLADLNLELRENSSIKAKLEEIQRQTDNYKTTCDEAFNENARLIENQIIHQNKLNHYEIELVPSMQKEMRNLHDTVEALQKNREQTILQMTQLEEEKAFIKCRNDLLLEKISEQLDTSDKFKVENMLLRKEIKDMNDKIREMYQNHEKSQELQKKLEETEATLRQNLTKEMEKVKTSYEVQITELKKKHKEEIDSVRKRYENAIAELLSVEGILKKENKALKSRQKTIVAVLPSPLDVQSQSEADNVFDFLEKPHQYMKANEAGPRPREGFTETGKNNLQFIPTRERKNEKSNRKAHLECGRPFVTSTSLSSINFSSDEMQANVAKKYLRDRGPNFKANMQTKHKSERGRAIWCEGNQRSGLNVKRAPVDYPLHHLGEELAKLVNNVDQGVYPATPDESHDKLDAISDCLYERLNRNNH